jgi:hypothetical protein
MAVRKIPKRNSAAPTRRSRAKALGAHSGHVRTLDPASTRSTHELLPALEITRRVMAAYAELPARLLACRSPMQFWGEYLRFGQRLLYQDPMDPSVQGRSGKRRRRKMRS